MMHRIRAVAATLMLAALGAGTVTAAGAGTAAGAATVPAVSTLTQIRAAHQSGYDRLVFQFSGVLPAHYSVRYVPQVMGTPRACRSTWSAAPGCWSGSPRPPGMTCWG